MGCQQKWDEHPDGWLITWMTQCSMGWPENVCMHLMLHLVSVVALLPGQPWMGVDITVLHVPAFCMHVGQSAG